MEFTMCDKYNFSYNFVRGVCEDGIDRYSCEIIASALSKLDNSEALSLES